ncbi:uncharacterized protein LOC130389430 [Gadus chalcogrammus]|uniref:uncharacterized protein LOC130389430 n=1 Tax=Gadus chalcogrammus TaxID=1042646 RepID=UPI0024C467F7|nr:uncharacterized protein LOC130389430 [Gadus chalcogrammus]
MPHVQGTTAAKLDKFLNQKDAWVANTKRNQVTSHLFDDAVILVEKMNALGWRPILLLEYPKKEAKMVLPEGLISGVGEQKCLDNIKEIYSIIVEGKKVPSDATSMPQGEGEAIFILHFEPEDPMKIQETLHSATPTTSTNEGLELCSAGVEPETVETVLMTSAATATDEGTQPKERKRVPRTRVETVLMTSAATATDKGTQPKKRKRVRRT